MSEIMFNDKNFEAEVLKSDKPVLVDFYASWCGPCRMQAPIIEELDKGFKGKVKIGKFTMNPPCHTVVPLSCLNFSFGCEGE